MQPFLHYELVVQYNQIHHRIPFDMNYVSLQLNIMTVETKEEINQLIEKKEIQSLLCEYDKKQISSFLHYTKAIFTFGDPVIHAGEYKEIKWHRRIFFSEYNTWYVLDGNKKITGKNSIQSRFNFFCTIYIKGYE